MVNYVKLVLLLSRVDDRKVVIGLYSYAHDVQNQFTETGYAHLSEFIQSFNEPIKRLSEEFRKLFFFPKNDFIFWGGFLESLLGKQQQQKSRSHIRTLEEALKSLLHPYQTKSAYVDPQWKNSDFLSLLAEHKAFNQIHMSSQNMILSEIVPLEDMESWIYFGFILCYNKFRYFKA